MFRGEKYRLTRPFPTRLIRKNVLKRKKKCWAQGKKLFFFSVSYTAQSLPRAFIFLNLFHTVRNGSFVTQITIYSFPVFPIVSKNSEPIFLQPDRLLWNIGDFISLLMHSPMYHVTITICDFFLQSFSKVVILPIAALEVSVWWSDSVTLPSSQVKILIVPHTFHKRRMNAL